MRSPPLPPRGAWPDQPCGASAPAPPPPPRTDPWRRTSGVHKLRNRRQLAIVRELWQTRDQVARSRDIAPGRVLPDAAIVEAAAAAPRTTEELLALPTFRGPAARRQARTWLGAIQRAAHLPADQLPVHSLPSDGPPPPRAWADRDPDAAARLGFARARLAELSDKLAIPVENLMTPDVVRRALWQPPTRTEVEDVLAGHGARPWQVELVAPIVRDALTRTAADQPAPADGADVPAVANGTSGRTAGRTTSTSAAASSTLSEGPAEASA